MIRNKVAALALTLFSSLPAAAAPTACIGSLPPGNYDAVVVPAGQGCGASGLNVAGNIVVEQDASLFLFFSSVGGNLIGQDAQAVHCGACTIAGNVTLQDTGINAGGQPVNMGGNTIGGNVVISGTTNFLNFGGNNVGKNLIVTDSVNIDSTQFGCGFFVQSNSVAGQLMVNDNTGPSCKLVFNNSAGKQIHCEGNDNFSAFGNSATKKHGQCQ